MVLAMAGAGGCAGTSTEPTDSIGSLAYQRQGDEIMIAGQLIRTGAPVVLWTDAGGYDAYRTERRFGPIKDASWGATEVDKRNKPAEPARLGTRFFRFAEKQPESFWGGSALSEETISRVRGGGWTLRDVQEVVDQFVLHYDVCGTSKVCFRVLHDVRGLSVHFMLDIDGTIYQTMDVKERAWHATVSNDRSVGIEIANMGAYASDEKSPLAQWYTKDASGRTIITIPQALGDGGVRTVGFVGSPDRPEPVVGPIQGIDRTQYDLTPQQYDSLTKLTAALCTALPKIRPDYPRDSSGQLITSKLPDDQLRAFTGVLGHYHVQDDKADPGPALQWERVVGGARAIMQKNGVPVDRVSTEAPAQARAD